MIRLHVEVEGQTERAFVRDVLAPHLLPLGVVARARCAQTGRKRSVVFKGGVLRYAQFRRDIELWMREDQNRDAFFSTMVDLYRLPDDFPGCKSIVSGLDPCERARQLERHFREDIRHPFGHFLPHIQPYEFEALLFTDPSAFSIRFPNHPDAVRTLQDMRAGFPTPEHVDSENSPAKRILSVIPDYKKLSDGPALAGAIGLAAIRGQCAHFNAWVTALEQLGQ
jgi:hypothetical protein